MFAAEERCYPFCVPPLRASTLPANLSPQGVTNSEVKVAWTAGRDDALVRRFACESPGDQRMARARRILRRIGAAWSELPRPRAASAFVQSSAEAMSSRSPTPTTPAAVGVTAHSD